MVLHTVIGKKHKYEVVRREKESIFRIYKDGEYLHGSYEDLRDAVKACEKDAVQGK